MLPASNPRWLYRAGCRVSGDTRRGSYKNCERGSRAGRRLHLQQPTAVHNHRALCGYFFFFLLLFAKCCCCYLKFKLIKDFSWQGPRNPTGECPIAAPFRLHSLGFCARSCHRLCWWLCAGSGVVAEMLRKVRPRGTRDTEFCFTEAPGICLLLAGGAGPVLVCAASTSPARAAPWQMPLGTAVKQTGTTIIRENKSEEQDYVWVWCNTSRHGWTGHWQVSKCCLLSPGCAAQMLLHKRLLAAKSPLTSLNQRCLLSPVFPCPKNHRVTGHTQMQINLLR